MLTAAGENNYQVSKAGTYETLYVNSTTGAYVVVANASAINALAAGATPSDSFTVTASDGSLTATSTLSTLSLHDALPIFVSTPTAISFTDTAAADTFANQTGTLSATDAE